MFYSICNIKHKIWYSRYQIMVNGWYKLCSVPNWTLCVIQFGTEIPWIIESQFLVHLSNLSDENRNKIMKSMNNIFSTYFLSWSESWKENRSKFCASLSVLQDLVTRLILLSKAHLNTTWKNRGNFSLLYLSKLNSWAVETFNLCEIFLIIGSSRHETSWKPSFE